MIIFQALDWQLGEKYQAWFTAAFPFVLLIALYLLVERALGQHKREVRQIVESHLPGQYFITDPNRLAIEMSSTVKRADKFIAATGGRSRNKEYLDAIESKVLQKQDIEYFRVILGDHIHHELHAHLERLYGRSNVRIRWHKKEIYGNILATEDRVILPYADPRPGHFGTAAVLTDPSIATQYMQFVLRLYGEADDITLEDLRSRCQECKKQSEKEV